MADWGVPGYAELKKLGSGGFGDVVLARHEETGTLVAIKYLRPELLSDPEFAERLRGEAAVLASISDPNVVRLYDYVESPSGAAIVMELVDGVSLRKILEGQGHTPPEAGPASSPTSGAPPGPGIGPRAARWRTRRLSSSPASPVTRPGMCTRPPP